LKDQKKIVKLVVCGSGYLRCTHIFKWMVVLAVRK